MAFGLVLVAWIVSRRAFHLAFVIVTRSAGAAAPGVTVIVVERVTPNHLAVMVAVVVADTAEVVTPKAPLAAPPFTSVSAGTCTTAVLLLDSWMIAPSVTPLNVIVPVVGLPPVSRDGLTDTADSDGPGGVAGLTESVAWRGVFWMEAVIWTLVAGAPALVVIGNVTVPWPAGATTEDGTLAVDGLLLNNRTVVGLESSGSRVTVPTDDAPPETVVGERSNDEMIAEAEAVPGGISSPASVDNVARTTKRRIASPSDRALMAYGRTRTSQDTCAVRKWFNFTQVAGVAVG
jgi:hypothetical protein